MVSIIPLITPNRKPRIHSPELPISDFVELSASSGANLIIATFQCVLDTKIAEGYSEIDILAFYEQLFGLYGRDGHHQLLEQRPSAIFDYVPFVKGTNFEEVASLLTQEDPLIRIRREAVDLVRDCHQKGIDAYVIGHFSPYYKGQDFFHPQ